MAKKIKLELTKRQFEALIDLIDTAASAFEEIDEEMNNLKLIDRMLTKNGYKRRFAMLTDSKES